MTRVGGFHWTPPENQPPGTSDVIVSVRGPEGQSDEQRFQITVTRPPPIPAPAKLSGKEIAVDLGGGVKLEMVLIPAGEFLMGSPDSDKNALAMRSRSTGFGSRSRFTWASIW